MSRSTIVFCLFIRALISIVAPLLIVITLHLTKILLHLLVFLDNSCIYSNRLRVALLASIATLTSKSIFFVWLSNDLARLGWLPTSIISKTGEQNLHSFNVSLKIFVPQKLMASSTSIIYLFYQKHRFLSGLSLIINFLLNNFFLIF